MARAKPSTPIWNPGRAPAGCKLYLPLSQPQTTVTGATFPGVFRDACSGYIGTARGTSNYFGTGPYGAWYGPGLVNTAGGIDLSAAAAALATSLPLWVAFMGSWADDGTGQYFFSLESSSAFLWAVRQSNATTMRIRDSSGAFSDATVPAAMTDGNVHVWQFVLRPTAHTVYGDGLQIATVSTTMAALSTLATVSLGCGGAFLGNTFPWGTAGGGKIYALAAGNGAVPDPAALANDWLSGTFAAVRPRSRMPLYSIAAQARPTAGASLLMGI